MNVNSSTYYSASSGKSSSSNKGISGMMSGMDTDSMVEQMLSGTQGKIDKQEALKQQTLWKQEIYRDIITNVNSFYSKYFDTGYGSSMKNNFANDSFFNSMISKVRSGDALRVISSSSNARPGDMKVAVEQLASTASVQSTQKLSSDEITGKTLTDADLVKNLSKTIKMKVDGNDYTINLNNATTQSDMLAAFNNQLGAEGIEAKVVNGRMRFVSQNPAKVIAIDVANCSELGLTMTGLGKTQNGVLTQNLHYSTGTDPITNNPVGVFDGGSVQPGAGSTITLTLDGVSKDIALNNVADSSGNITAESVMKSIEDQVQTAFGTYVKVEDISDPLDPTARDGKLQLKFSVTGTGHELRITGMEAGRVGITAGSSTLISTASTLGSLKDQLGLQGDRYSFTINGKDFSFTSEQTLGTVINTVNNSDAGVKLSYSAMSDTFRMEATSSGAEFGIDVQQKEGNLLSALFNTRGTSDIINSAGTVASGWLTTGKVVGTNTTPGLPVGYQATSGSMSMTVNGRNYTFSLPEKPNNIYTKGNIEGNLNIWLKDTFGEKTPGTANIEYVNGELRTQAGFAVSFNQTKIDLEDKDAVAAAKKTDFGLAFGFTVKGATNIATKDTNISDVLLAGGLTYTKADGTPATTLDDIAAVSDGTNTYAAAFTDGRLALTGSGTVTFAAGSDFANLFGDKTITMGDGKLDPNDVSAGKDAIVFINGVETTRSSNNFTIDGVTMELTKVSAADATNSTGFAETVIGTSRDADSIVDSFKNFVDDYNAMLEKVIGYVNQDADCRDYPPLTAAQRADMSENEIESWEKKAKTGLIRHDSTVTTMLNAMRTTLYTKPEGATYALYNIGIETTEDTKKGGKLTFDEAALRDALSADPDAVRQLFTDSVNGLSKQLTATMDNAVKTRGAAPGTLVQLAGMPNTTSEKSSSMYKKLQEIETNIKDLKKKYEKERARYWNQFNSMEQVLANYNSQSSYISQQFGGY